MTGRILVVDGSATNRITMKVRLSAACYQVSTASSGLEALHLHAQIKPQIILIGAALPDMPPNALCTMLRNQPNASDVPILVEAQGSSRLAALQAGASGLLDAPTESMTMMARIRGLIRQNPQLSDPATGLAETTAQFNSNAQTAQVTVIGDSPGTALGWRHFLQSSLDVSMAVSAPEKALADAGNGWVPDLYMIAADIRQTGDGLRLLSELRSRNHSRDAAFMVVLGKSQSDMGAIALDLGAGDILHNDFTQTSSAAEIAMRMKALISRKKEGDKQRDTAQRSLIWAMTDALTGLYNRRYAMPRLSEIAAQSASARESFAVILIDLDRFKLINDIYGHASGDTVLATIARRLAHALPSDALVARIGGEEFVAAIPTCDENRAFHLANMMREHVMRQPVILPASAGSAAINVTFSAGIAIGRSDKVTQFVPDPEVLLARADKALLQAKASGRDCIILAPEALAA